jgi:hypothetical protein
VSAIDGYSGFIVSLFTNHRKNVVDVAQMYKDIIEHHGVWDQIRVDHGREFYLMCHLQYAIRGLRFNTNRSDYVQTISRMNRVIGK